MNVRRESFLSIIFLVLITGAAYFAAIRYGGYVWDDDSHLTRNPMIFAADGLGQIWSQANWRTQFYPLTFTTFWLQYRMSGLDPAAYHLGNVLFHAANVLLLWYLLKRLGLRGAFWIAAVFAVHPINVESVAWVTERKNVLSGFFYLLAAIAYVRFDEMERPFGERKGWGLFVLCWIAFAAALFSKTVTCTFPAGMAAVSWWKRGRLGKVQWVTLGPMAVAGIGLGAYTALLEKTVVGSVGKAWDYSVIDRILIAGRAVCFYVGKLLWPTDLMFSYPLWKMNAPPVWMYFCPVAVVVLLWVLWRQRGKWGRGPFAAAMFFLVTVSPALGFVDYYTMIYSLVADHYVYLAMIGLAALVIEPVVWMVSLRPLVERRALGAGGVAVLALLAGMTWVRCLAYRDSETLWRDTVAKNPDSWLGHTLLGIELRHDKDSAGAIGEFQEALLLNPAGFQALNGIGTMLVDAGRLKESEVYFEKVIELSPRVPEGYTNLAAVELREGRLPEAARLFREAIALDAYNEEARLNYGNLLGATHQYAEAAKMAEQVLAVNPENAGAEQLLARSLANQGKVEEAIPHFEAVVRLRPGDEAARQEMERAAAWLARRNAGSLPAPAATMPAR